MLLAVSLLLQFAEGGMRFGSILIFAVAVLCAGGAALLVRSVLTAPAAEPLPVAEAKPASVPMRTVLVAARDLRAGEKLTAAAIREAAWPAEYLPKGAFTSRDALFRGGDEPLLYAGIAEKEPVLAQRLLGNPDSLAGRLNDGMRAITIRVNETSSVGGFVQPEDRVDVLLTQTERPGEAGAGAMRAYTKTLVQNVRLLAADQQTQRKAQIQPPKTVTLEVSEDDAKRLTLAGAIGQLSLTLNKGEAGAAASRLVDLRDIAGFQDEIRGNPGSAEPGTPLVSVFRSVERKDYRVPQE
jgi:pilus assembly protein CpaB